MSNGRFHVIEYSKYLEALSKMYFHYSHIYQSALVNIYLDDFPYLNNFVQEEALKFFKDILLMWNKK